MLQLESTKGAVKSVVSPKSRLKIIQWWAFIALMTFSIQLWTIGYQPQYSQDEVQITDYGRLALNPDSEWAATWLLQKERPLMLWSYLGPLSSELGYQIFGKSGSGPRIISLLGGVFAATMMLCWLRQRKVPSYVALALSLAFLLDPFFVLSQRPARVDSWVIGFMLTSCYLFRGAMSSSIEKRKFQIIGAGAMVVIATFIWPSAIFLYPLVGLEFLYFLQTRAQLENYKNLIFLSISYFVCGGSVMLILLLLPLWSGVGPLFNDLFNVVSLNVKSNQSIADRFLQLFDYELWLKLGKAFIKTLSPLLPLFALLGAIFRKEKYLIIATLAASALIVVTLVYEFRILYLLPYLIALFGGLYERFEIKPSSLFLRKVSKVLLVVIVIWSTGISLFVRSFIAIKEKDYLTITKLQQAATTNIGPGNYKVFMANTYELYYVGRSIGWKIYNLYPIWNYNTSGAWVQLDLNKPAEKFVSLLSRMDYAIFMENSITKDMTDDISKSGMRFHKRIIVNNPDKDFSDTNNRTWELILGYLRGNKNHGSYIVYKRSL